MKYWMSRIVVLLGLVLLSACTLSTTGLRPPSDHSLVYPQPEPEPVAAAPAPAPVCKPPTTLGTPGDLSGCKTGDKVVLRGLNFAVNSAELSAEGRKLLDLVAVAMLEAPSISVEIGGHTDSAGTDEYNLMLSGKRVASVQNYLAVKGVPSTRMSLKAYGETVPVGDNNEVSGRAMNRRVELIVTSQMGAQAMPAQPTSHHVAAAPTEPAHVQASPVVRTKTVPAPPGGSEVSIIDNAFVPETLTVTAGTTVTWTNTGGSNHKIKFSDATSERLRSGAQYSRTMNEVGTFPYECAIHGSRMSGQIIVK